MCDFTLDFSDGCYKWAISTLAKSCTIFGSNDTFLNIRWGYGICALVSRFLRFGNFLNPTNGLSLKVLTQSLLCSIMFQFE